MAFPGIALRTAQRLVKDYASEADLIILDHKKAMACRDCEDFLQIGLDAHKWIARFEEEIRSLAYNGKVAITQEVIDALNALYADWLRPCANAERRIAKQLEEGFVPANKDEFHSVCEHVRGLNEHRQWIEIARTSSESQLQAEPW